MLFASWVRLFNVYSLDDRLRAHLIAPLDTLIKKSFDSHNISIILIDKDVHPDPQDKNQNLPSGNPDTRHRHYHAQLIRALAGKAKVVVFDVEFKNQDPTVDPEFAAAIAEAEKLNTRIVVAADVDEQDPRPSIPLSLEPALKDRWATWGGCKYRGTKSVRLVLRETDQQLLIPSLALRAVEEFRYPADVQAFFDPLTDMVHLRRGGASGSIEDSIPVNSAVCLTVDLVGQEDQGRRNLYHNVITNLPDVREFTDKIVVIGYQSGDEREVSESEKRYGAEIHANAISNLLQHDFIKPLAIGYEYLVILSMVALGGVLRLGFAKLANYTLPLKLPGGVIDKQVQIPTMLLAATLLYCFVASLAYMLERTVFNVSYHIVALFLAYLTVGAVRARLGLS